MHGHVDELACVGMRMDLHAYVNVDLSVQDHLLTLCGHLLTLWPSIDIVWPFIDSVAIVDIAWPSLTLCGHLLMLCGQVGMDMGIGMVSCIRTNVAYLVVSNRGGGQGSGDKHHPKVKGGGADGLASVGMQIRPACK